LSAETEFIPIRPKRDDRKEERRSEARITKMSGICGGRGREGRRRGILFSCSLVNLKIANGSGS